jgi:hypothetical protein
LKDSESSETSGIFVPAAPQISTVDSIDVQTDHDGYAQAQDNSATLLETHPLAAEVVKEAEVVEEEHPILENSGLNPIINDTDEGDDYATLWGAEENQSTSDKE